MDLLSLWLPILVSSVVVFFAGFIAWTVLPHHKADWSKLPDEDAFNSALKSLGLQPGPYMFPYAANNAECKSEEFKKRWAEGPCGTLNLWPGEPNMGLSMFCSFVFYLVVGVFVGYIGTLALKPGASFLEVFQLTGTAAVLAYSFGGIPNAIWFRKKFGAAVNDVIDGIAYGLLTAVIFGLMWPSAASAIPG